MGRRRLRVLVTRPAGQASGLCRLAEAAGFEAVRLAAIEIRESGDPEALQRLAGKLDSYDLAVFISVNAVTYGLDYLLAREDWPAQVKIATVGSGSAAALREYGLAPDLVPAHRFNSEGLLALEDLQDMRGKRVVILRGNGGRDHLCDTLRARGAVVDYVEVYRRACPEIDPQLISALLQPGMLDVVTVTSNETLLNLMNMAGPAGQPLLRVLPLVVVSERQALLAQELGFEQAAMVAENASDAALVEQLKTFAMRNR
ncbi:MAG TPA: uroporphyrinogen-III synthase [Gammaproteobacteria bacterium]|nr:uroporphyrinogen-III synthase [Gammaproteobacteria bacterium]